MPNIKLDQKVTKDQVREVLRTHCPDLDVMRFGAMITASTSRWVGTMVAVNGKRVSLAPMVRSLPMFGLLALMALSGIGIVLYAVLAVPKQMALTKRVHAVLARELPRRLSAPGARADGGTTEARREPDGSSSPVSPS